MLAPGLTSSPPPTDSLVTIGRILKPFGVRGAVKVESLSDVPGRFEGLQSVYLTLPYEGATPRKTAVTQVRNVTAGYLIKCSAFSTPEEAAHFRGAYPQHHVLVIRSQETEFLIPANRKTIKKVDLDNQCLHIASKEWWDISHAL